MGAAGGAAPCEAAAARPSQHRGGTRLRERRHLEGIRAALLRAREAGPRGGDSPELEQAQQRFLEFKRRQLAALANMEKDLAQQKDLLKKREVEEGLGIPPRRVPSGSQEELGGRKEEEGGVSILWAAGGGGRAQPAEGRLQCMSVSSGPPAAAFAQAVGGSRESVRSSMRSSRPGQHFVPSGERDGRKEEQLAVPGQAPASTRSCRPPSVHGQRGPAEEKVRRKGESPGSESSSSERRWNAMARLERRHSALPALRPGMAASRLGRKPWRRTGRGGRGPGHRPCLPGPGL